MSVRWRWPRGLILRASVTNVLLLSWDLKPVITSGGRSSCNPAKPTATYYEWLAARLEDLDSGYIDGITAAVRKYPLEGVKKDEIDTALGYFENNAPRMRYKWFRQCGLFVGSGVVESSCKTGPVN